LARFCTPISYGVKLTKLDLDPSSALGIIPACDDGGREDVYLNISPTAELDTSSAGGVVGAAAPTFIDR
jgi:hypothetical protein